MIILASSSERRITLLKDAGVEFKVVPSNVDEVIDIKASPLENALNLSKLKAYDVFNKNTNDVIIAADTIVTYKNEIFGKPKDSEDAFNILKRLSNKTHEVITAVTIINSVKEESFYCKTKVTFKDLTDEDILEYIATEEPFGKAGCYAIQGIGKDLIETFDGDLLNVVGLPLKDVLKKLEEFKEENIEK